MLYKTMDNGYISYWKEVTMLEWDCATTREILMKSEGGVRFVVRVTNE